MIARTVRRLTASVALGAGIAASVLYAPAAHADSSSFLDEIHALGWYNNIRGDVGLLDQGYAVCRALGSGMNGAQVATIIYRSTGLDVSVEDAAEFVVISVDTLCPAFDHRGESDAAA